MKKLMLCLFSVVLVMLCVNTVKAITVNDVVSDYEKSAAFKKLDNGKVTLKDNVVTITYGTSNKVTLPVKDGVIEYSATGSDYEVVKGFIESALKTQGYSDADIQKIYSNGYTYTKNGIEFTAADKNATYFASKIKSLVSSDSNLKLHDSKLTNGAGDNSYRYSGAYQKVNNWVAFGDSKYRTKSSDGYCTSDYYYGLAYVTVTEGDNHIEYCQDTSHAGDHGNGSYTCTSQGKYILHWANGAGFTLNDLPSDVSELQVVDEAVYTSTEDFIKRYEYTYIGKPLESVKASPDWDWSKLDNPNETIMKNASVTTSNIETPVFSVNKNGSKYVINIDVQVNNTNGISESNYYNHNDKDYVSVPIKFKAKYKTTSGNCGSDVKDLYRVVGVFGDKVKLIKGLDASSDLLGDSAYSSADRIYTVYDWNPTGVNTWSEALLNTNNLNSIFLTNIGSKWANFIDYEDWVVGGNTTDKILNVTASDLYKNEVKTTVKDPSGATTYNAKVGLMYLSDFMYASTKENWTKTITQLNNTNDLYSMDWISIGGSNWTITRNSSTTDEAYITNVVSSTTTAKTHDSKRVKPAFYLVPTTTYTGGVGTYDDPFTISTTTGKIKCNILNVTIDKTVKTEVVTENPKTGAAIPVIAGILLIAGAFGIRYYTKRKNVINNV